MATVISYQARTRRLVHFVLVVGAFFIGAGANLLVDLGRHDAIAESTWWQISIVGAAAFVVYLVAAIRVSYADPILLPVALLLNLIGLAEIKSVDLVYEQYTKWNHGFAPRQVIWTVLGLALTAAVLLILRDHRQLRRYTWITGAIGLIFLLMPLMPGIGAANYGARIWIRVAGYSFQPAEIAKILFAMFFAGFLVSRRDTLALAGPRVLGITLPRWSDLGPILVAWLCATAVLVFPRGEAIVVFRVEVDEVGVGSNVFSRGGGAIKPLDLAQGLKRECDDQIQVLDRSRTLAPAAAVRPDQTHCGFKIHTRKQFFDIRMVRVHAPILHYFLTSELRNRV